MHKTAFAELVSRLRLLTPQQLAQLGTAVTGSQRQVEAVLALDARCGEKTGQGCPRCTSSNRCRWGHTRTGAQRWRCDDCNATWSGLTGTPIAGIRRPDLFIDLVRNMIEAEKPWSCRKAAKELDISRHTAWRWRMAIIRLLPAERQGVMSGIVEADEARQRESRKASREWVRYRADPLNVPRPPREPWRFYKNRNATVKAPPGGWLAWNKNLVAVTDRGGHRAMEAVNKVTEHEVSAALLPTMAPDAVLCTDGHATYEAIAKTTRITHFALNAGKRSRRTPKTHHINTVNALIGRYRDFIRPFCGPASQNLKAYGRWHAARENGDRDYLSVFKAFLDAPRPANTLC